LTDAGQNAAVRSAGWARSAALLDRPAMDAGQLPSLTADRRMSLRNMHANLE